MNIQGNNKVNKTISKNDIIEKFIIVLASILLIYFIISLYFTKHFFFHTTINGVDVSLKAYQEADELITDYIKNYELQLVERNKETEVIKGADINLKFNAKNSINNIYRLQNSFTWISALFKDCNYYVPGLYKFDQDKLVMQIEALNCLNKEIIEPQNVSFIYENGSYQVVDEIYGDRVITEKLKDLIQQYIWKGNQILNIDEKQCYQNPKYTRNSKKTRITKNKLDHYVSSKITYVFGSESEIISGKEINQWLVIDADLEVVINYNEVRKYIKTLSKKYDTVGIGRSFKTSMGKTVEVKGGIYGWKISQEEETKALIENIKSGGIVEKEPAYGQKAISREKNDIGNTYVEINITRQHLWFYKNGKLITQSAVVTGNPNRGNATVLGTYMINYKQKEAVLKGIDYEAKVTYWMPFYGNIGLHDASWRYSFGGEIYKRRGTHGCVNLPYGIAKTIFQYIEEGVPIIVYEE